MDTYSMGTLRTQLSSCPGRNKDWFHEGNLRGENVDRSVFRLTVHSSLVTSLLPPLSKTARITPDRQPHSAILPIFSFPETLTQRNRLPTSSSRYSIPIMYWSPHISVQNGEKMYTILYRRSWHELGCLQVHSIHVSCVLCSSAHEY